MISSAEPASTGAPPATARVTGHTGVGDGFGDQRGGTGVQADRTNRRSTVVLGMDSLLFGG